MNILYSRNTIPQPSTREFSVLLICAVAANSQTGRGFGGNSTGCTASSTGCLFSFRTRKIATRTKRQNITAPPTPAPTPTALLLFLLGDGGGMLAALLPVGVGPVVNHLTLLDNTAKDDDAEDVTAVGEVAYVCCEGVVEEGEKREIGAHCCTECGRELRFEGGGRCARVIKILLDNVSRFSKKVVC
ncbi:hypothetical protein BDU57DRAFT_20356 [Ampelomyces quisqualis]|uniref:Uncharacterized protein n=1 Tax=Ampelomyces quisqualis TaxID=50730 RepID=A0A6A5R0J1_AMPQU|nr:hypothetical protein BDU57DRAFT_20356 [Ampelomyces quisqualis]